MKRFARRLSPAAILLLFAACRGEAPPSATSGEPPPPVEARAAVDRAVVTVGDVITYTLTVEHDPAYAVEVEEPGDEIAGLRVVERGREPAGEAGDGARQVEECWYRLRADHVGSYVLPPVSVSYRAERGEGGAGEEQEAATARTSEIFLEVESVLPADGSAEDIRDIKPLHRPEPWPRWWLAAAAAILLTLAALLWRRRRRRVDEAPAEPPAPPHEVALTALEELRALDLSDPEVARRYCFRLSEVARTYVEGRFGLNATDLTTEEILPRLGGLDGLPPASGAELARVLRRTDRVKFAHHRPAPAELEELHELALGFVEATRARPPVEGEETEGAEREGPRAA